MALHTATLWRLVVLSVVFATTMGQQCYFPDGSSSTDVPCSTGSGESSCCGTDEYCMANGLCFGAGLFSRGTCTDRTWGSEACASFCRTETLGTITPCPTTSSNDQTFTCGLNTSTCSSSASTFTLPSNTTLLLRPSQLATLNPPTHHLYSPATVAGLTLGLTLPLLLALLLSLHFLRAARARQSGPKLMYKLPDNHSDFPPSHHLRPNPSSYSLQSGFTASRRASVGTTHSGVGKPAHFQTFVERYGKKDAVAELGTGVNRWELDGVEAGSGGRGSGSKSGWVVELPGKRTSAQQG